MKHNTAFGNQKISSGASADFSALAYRFCYHDRSDFYLESIESIDALEPSLLLHIDQARSQLIDNTACFIQSEPSNDALLVGARGTGKSSLVKSMLRHFAGSTLRLIEIERDDLIAAPVLFPQLKNRAERFVFFCDDLSFDSNEKEYRALKSVLEGSIAARPDNVLVYATSNRRHLVPEYLEDNLHYRHEGEEIHPSEAVEDKLALADRFGLWLSFYSFDQSAYVAVARSSLQRLGCNVWDDNTEQQALLYARSRGSRSGRIAWQFARFYVGQLALKNKPIAATKR